MATYEYVILGSDCGHSGLSKSHAHTREISAINTAAKTNIPSGAVISKVELYLDANYDSSVGDPDMYFYFCPNDNAGTGTQLLKSTIGSSSTIRTADITSYVTKTYPFSINTSYPKVSVYYKSTLGKKYHCDKFKVIYTYSIPTYTINVVANNNSYGYTTGSGTYNSGTALTISAHPYAGYKFVQWSDGNTSATRTITVTGNATYTAYFEPVYVSYDSIFSFKRWANNNLTSWDLITISNVTDTGFTGTATVDDAYTTECRPLIPVEAGKTYTFECTASGGGFEFFVFNCESSGAWSDFTYGNTQSFNFTPTKSYVSIRCDVVGTGTVVNFSNFRIYPADCPYMSNSVSATDRTDVASWSMPTPTREGYTFKGWNTKPDGSGTTYTSSSTFPTADLVLYSQWEEVKPEIKSVQMIYLDKQISETNKVPCGEGFVISVELS